MALAAMAVEGGTLTSAISSVMGVVSTVMSTIKNDEILLAFFCAGLIGVAIGVVKALK